MNVLISLPAILCGMYFILVVAHDELPSGPKNPYCVQQLCPRGKRHIACEKPPMVSVALLEFERISYRNILAHCRTSTSPAVFRRAR